MIAEAVNMDKDVHQNIAWGCQHDKSLNQGVLEVFHTEPKRTQQRMFWWHSVATDAAVWTRSNS